MLQEDVVDFPQQQHVAIVVVHELLDRQLRLRVAIAEALRQLALVIEQKAIFATTSEHVQAEADAPQKSPPFEQPATFQACQKTGIDQFRRRRRTRMRRPLDPRPAASPRSAAA